MSSSAFIFSRCACEILGTRWKTDAHARFYADALNSPEGTEFLCTSPVRPPSLLSNSESDENEPNFPLPFLRVGYIGDDGDLFYVFESGSFDVLAGKTSPTGRFATRSLSIRARAEGALGSSRCSTTRRGWHQCKCVRFTCCCAHTVALFPQD